MDKPARPARKRRSADQPSKSDLTRQRILDSAARVFATRGYGHTRLADVAREAGTHAGGIYYYFASREDLVAEVLDLATERAIAKLTAALADLPEGAGARDRLLAAATASLSLILSDDLFNIAHARIYPQVPEDVQVRNRPLLRRYFALWRGIIEDGRRAGEIRSDLDPTVLRMTIVGSIQWATEWASSAGSPAPDLARMMMSAFFEGIFTPAAG